MGNFRATKRKFPILETSIGQNEKTQRICCFYDTHQSNKEPIIRHVFVFADSTYQGSPSFWKWRHNCVRRLCVEPITNEPSIHLSRNLGHAIVSAEDTFRYFCEVTPTFYTCLTEILRSIVLEWAAEIQMLSQDLDQPKGRGFIYHMSDHFNVYAVHLHLFLCQLMQQSHTTLLCDRAIFFLKSCFSHWYGLVVPKKKTVPRRTNILHGQGNNKGGAQTSVQLVLPEPGSDFSFLNW